MPTKVKITANLRPDQEVRIVVKDCASGAELEKFRLQDGERTTIHLFSGRALSLTEVQK